MNYPLALAFLFYWGAIEGWILEFFFRNLISHKGPKGKFFINPGLCKGPWLPIYGIGLATMFVICWEVSTRVHVTGILGKIVIILIIAAVMTLIELVGGIFLLKVLNIRLWDYRDRPGNIKGVICPLFTVIWGALGAIYYLFIHSVAIDELNWLSNNLAFSFVIGLFFGFFAIDLWYSSKVASKIKKYGDINDVVIKLEELKALLITKEKELEGKQKSFVNQVKIKYDSIADLLDETKDILEDKKDAFVSRTKALRKKEK